LDNELQAGVAFIGDDVTGIDSLEPPWPAWSMRSDDLLTEMQVAGDRVAKRVNASRCGDSPNSADVIIDALRCPTIAQDRGLRRPASMTVIAPASSTR